MVVRAGGRWPCILSALLLLLLLALLAVAAAPVHAHNTLDLDQDALGDSETDTGGDDDDDDLDMELEGGDEDDGAGDDESISSLDMDEDELATEEDADSDSSLLTLVESLSAAEGGKKDKKEDKVGALAKAAKLKEAKAKAEKEKADREESILRKAEAKIMSKAGKKEKKAARKQKKAQKNKKKTKKDQKKKQQASRCLGGRCARRRPCTVGVSNCKKLNRLKRKLAAAKKEARKLARKAAAMAARKMRLASLKTLQGVREKLKKAVAQAHKLRSQYKRLLKALKVEQKKAKKSAALAVKLRRQLAKSEKRRRKAQQVARQLKECAAKAKSALGKCRTPTCRTRMKDHLNVIMTVEHAFAGHGPAVFLPAMHSVVSDLHHSSVQNALNAQHHHQIAYHLGTLHNACMYGNCLLAERVRAAAAQEAQQLALQHEAALHALHGEALGAGNLAISLARVASDHGDAASMMRALDAKRAALAAIQNARAQGFHALNVWNGLPQQVHLTAEGTFGGLMHRLAQAASLAGWRRANFASRALADRAAAAHAAHLIAAHSAQNAHDNHIMLVHTPGPFLPSSPGFHFFPLRVFPAPLPNVHRVVTLHAPSMAQCSKEKPCAQPRSRTAKLTLQRANKVAVTCTKDQTAKGCKPRSDVHSITIHSGDLPNLPVPLARVVQWASKLEPVVAQEQQQQQQQQQGEDDEDEEAEEEEDDDEEEQEDEGL